MEQPPPAGGGRSRSRDSDRARPHFSERRHPPHRAVPSRQTPAFLADDLSDSDALSSDSQKLQFPTKTSGRRGRFPPRSGASDSRPAFQASARPLGPTDSTELLDLPSSESAIERTDSTTVIDLSSGTDSTSCVLFSESSAEEPLRGVRLKRPVDVGSSDSELSFENESDSP
jgi:hypothetical protein